jgi:uncharacterized protein YecE (DUF72 family)
MESATARETWGMWRRCVRVLRLGRWGAARRGAGGGAGGRAGPPPGGRARRGARAGRLGIARCDALVIGLHAARNRLRRELWLVADVGPGIDVPVPLPIVHGPRYGRLRSRRPTIGVHHMDDQPHDPGVQAANQRAVDVEDAASRPIELHDGGVLRIGTASWTDPTMTAPGVFYPDGANSAEERLNYYASRLPIVEVDATYYALPARRTGELWLERTPADFTFDIKAHALMTGQPTEVARLPKSLREQLPAELLDQKRIYRKDLPAELYDAVWELFRDGIAPLHAAGKLGAVFLQYPRWLFPSNETRQAILDEKQRLGDIGMAVEFRHGSWFNEKNAERTLRFLEDNQIPFVMVDGPQGLRSSIPPVVAATSSTLAVVRFHGRRAETWEKSGIPVVERFRYLYDGDELGEWVPRIREASRQVRETHILMNNCYANYGTTNAREIAHLLRQTDGAAS